MYTLILYSCFDVSLPNQIYLRPSPYILLNAKVFRRAGLKEKELTSGPSAFFKVRKPAEIYLRDNESNADFGYEETIAILLLATGDLGFGPKC